MNSTNGHLRPTKNRQNKVLITAGAASKSAFANWTDKHHYSGLPFFIQDHLLEKYRPTIFVVYVELYRQFYATGKTKGAATLNVKEGVARTHICEKTFRSAIKSLREGGYLLTLHTTRKSNGNFHTSTTFALCSAPFQKDSDNTRKRFKPAKNSAPEEKSTGEQQPSRQEKAKTSRAVSRQNQLETQARELTQKLETCCPENYPATQTQLLRVKREIERLKSDHRTGMAPPKANPPSRYRWVIPWNAQTRCRLYVAKLASKQRITDPNSLADSIYCWMKDDWAQSQASSFDHALSLAGKLVASNRWERATLPVVKNATPSNRAFRHG